MRSKLFITLACLLAAGSGPALGQEADRVASAEPDGIHIGLLAPLSGPFEPLGRQVEEGVGLALAAQGEEAGPFTVTAVDDGCDEARGREAASQLVEAGVDVVIGGVCWRPAVAARNVFAFADLPFVSSGVRHGAFTDEADGPVFRVAGRDDLQGQSLVQALVAGELDGLVGAPATGQPLVLFYTDGSYGRTLAESVQQGLTQEGVALALYEAFEADGDLASLAERALALDPGLVMVLAGQADSALLADALRQAMPDVALLAGDSVMTSEFRALADSAVANVVFARPTPWRFIADAERVASLVGEDVPVPSGLVLPSIAATQIALAMLGGEAGSFETVLGPVRFDALGDADLPSFQLWQWREGFIWPLEGEDENG